MLDLFHNKNAQALANWTALLTAFFTGVGKLSPDWFGELSWAQLILAAFGAALATLLIIGAAAFLLGAGGALYRQFRPLADAPATPGATANDGTLSAKVDNMTEIMRLLADDAKALSDRVLAVEETAKEEPNLAVLNVLNEERFRELAADLAGAERRLSGALDGLKKAVQDQDEKRKMHLQVLEGKLEELKGKTRNSIHAIWMRERIAEISRDIRKDAAYLSRHVVEGQAHDAISWDRWDNVYGHWWSLMTQWWMLARFYMANTRQILLAPDNMFAKTQVDESLLMPVGGAEAVRVYKKFRIIQDQWEAAQKELEDNLIQVAFVGLSEEDVRHGQPLDQGAPAV